MNFADAIQKAKKYFVYRDGWKGTKRENAVIFLDKNGYFLIFKRTFCKRSLTFPVFKIEDVDATDWATYKKIDYKEFKKVLELIKEEKIHIQLQKEEKRESIRFERLFRKELASRKAKQNNQTNPPQTTKNKISEQATDVQPPTQDEPKQSDNYLR